MAGVNSQVEASKSGWFDSALDSVSQIMSVGLQGWKGYEDIQTSKQSAQIKNAMTQAEGETNLALLQMQAGNQRFLNNILVIGGLGIAFVMLYKMLR